MNILHEMRCMDNDPRDHPVIDPYRATPETIAHAKAMAAVERVCVQAELDAAQKRRARSIVRQLVLQHGQMYMLTLVQAVADEMEAEAEAQR